MNERLGRVYGVLVFGVSLVMIAGAARAEDFLEDFSLPPLSRGWQIFGESALYEWDQVSQSLEVTWDSSKPNSYFYRPLPTILTLQDDFRISFDLRMQEIGIGVNLEKPYTFQLAIGLIGFAAATRTNFYRGSGLNATYGPRNLMTFDYFPDSGFGATFAPTAVSTNNRIAFSDNHPLELTLGDLFRVSMEYSATDRILRTKVTRNGEMYGVEDGAMIRDLVLSQFPDWRLDAFAVCSYNDGQQFPSEFAGSILAHGWIDNIEWMVPESPISEVKGSFLVGKWQVRFMAKAGWYYELRRSVDFSQWTVVDETLASESGSLVLEDATLEGFPSSFYRVVANRP